MILFSELTTSGIYAYKRSSRACSKGTALLHSSLLISFGGASISGTYILSLEMHADALGICML